MTSQAHVRMTVAEYLAFERAQEQKHEYLDGYVHQCLLTEITDVQGSVHLATINCTLRLEDIYKQVVRRTK